MAKQSTRLDRWEATGRALWLLQVGLRSHIGLAIRFDRQVHSRLQVRIGEAHTDLDDVQSQLKVLQHSPRIREELFRDELAYYEEINRLVEFRNRWAHMRSISTSDLDQLLLDCLPLLVALDANAQVDAIRELQDAPTLSIQEANLNSKAEELEEERESLRQMEARLNVRRARLEDAEQELSYKEVSLDSVLTAAAERHDGIEPGEPEPYCGPCPRPGCDGTLYRRVRTRDQHPFVGCSRYRTRGCRFSRSVPFEGEPILERCPRCNSQLVLRDDDDGGYYVGCADYPTCNYAIEYRESLYQPPLFRSSSVGTTVDD